MDYLESLNLFKSSLLGGTEVSLISRIVNDNFENQKHITWLDVGIGDGDSLRRILDEIDSEHIIEVTGVDPILENSNAASEIFPHAELIASEFEKYETDKKFDFVNVRQSLYYLENTEKPYCQ